MSDTAKQPKPPYRVAQLAARLGVHKDTIYDWITDGVLVAGQRVYLRAVRVGRILFVRRRDWRAFLRAQPNERPGPPAPPPRTRASPSAQARARAAIAELERVHGKKLV